eukprot:CAMPEP_0181203834 /NCGR_PEP_ID=MMETSP1096-20121128/19605_1 /TAXON_ID=156174 ORGANISM="Chrysochromulina ericina, Strain CCMP281" /NCGR_SAMPLE_ID=MMETSP1096 /ASSEMBLY_ACC=CAM_ASM_000453 /LENGTH=60 /DNA_ID=CAMNT_0023294477 /DNA_START=490 /DNA_END=669 /DNA_ORIENTATION=+
MSAGILKLASAYGGSMWSTIRLTPSGGGLVTPLPVGGATGRFVGAYRRSSSCFMSAASRL